MIKKNKKGFSYGVFLWCFLWGTIVTIPDITPKKLIKIPAKVIKFKTPLEGKKLAKSVLTLEKSVSSNGCASSTADVINRTIYGVALGDALPPVDMAGAGFVSSGMQNNGPVAIPITVSVMVTFLKLKGPVIITLIINRDGHTVDVNNLNVNASGSYTLSTTKTIQMEPNNVYSVGFFITIEAQSNFTVRYFMGRIGNISWNF